MTAYDRFDPFEQRITAAIDDIAAPRRPAYLDDILRQTERSSQRPRWSFPGRWLPLDTTFVPARMAGRIPARPMLFVVTALLLAALAAIAVIGAANREAPPFGLARNGELAFVRNGDLWTSPDPAAAPRVIISDGEITGGVAWSPNGQLIAYAVAGLDGDRFWVANRDGSNAHPIHDGSIAEGWAQAAWAPDSSTFAITGRVDGRNRLLLAAADGSGAREIETGAAVVWDVVFDPRNADRMLLRLQARAIQSPIDLFVADADGAEPRSLGLLRGPSAFGYDYTLSGSAWSPSQDVIAYNSAETDPATLAPSYRVHLVNADGTNDRAVPGPGDPNVHEGWPVYSPDGKWLLVHRWISRQAGDLGDGWLAIMPADGSAAARDIGPRLTEGDGADVLKTWSPDGSHVLMQTEDGDVFIVDPFADTWEPMPFTTTLPDWQRRAP